MKLTVLSLAFIFGSAMVNAQEVLNLQSNSAVLNTSIVGTDLASPLNSSEDNILNLHSVGNVFSLDGSIVSGLSNTQTNTAQISAAATDFRISGTDVSRNVISVFAIGNSFVAGAAVNNTMSYLNTVQGSTGGVTATTTGVTITGTDTVSNNTVSSNATGNVSSAVVTYNK